MEGEFDNYTNSYGSSLDYVTEFITYNFSTCQEYLALNLSGFNMTAADLIKQNPVLLEDSCNHTVTNTTYVDSHPIKYAVLIAYPILLFICTLGNTLNLIILAREKPTRPEMINQDTSGSVKRIYLISLAFSDLSFM